MINFKRIPQSKLPERLIYKAGDKYTMFSTKTGEVLGSMVARERQYGKICNEDFEYYPKKENYTSLYIVGLLSNIKRKGIGRAFIEFAKKLADNPRCENRITVFAMNNQDGNILKASSPFFRKCGFSSAEKPGLNDCDRVIKGLRPLNGDWYCSLPMYLPVPKKKK